MDGTPTFRTLSTPGLSPDVSAFLVRMLNLEAPARGVDWSRWQPPENINYELVAGSGMVFTISRNSVGDYYTDPAVGPHTANSRRVGMLDSRYHVDRPDKTTAAQLERLKMGSADWDTWRPQFPWVTDVEVVRPCRTCAPFDPNQIADSALEMTEAVHAWDGRPPTVYTAKWVESYVRLPSGELASAWRELCARYEGHIADYTFPPFDIPQAYLEAGGLDRIRMHQITDHGRVPGYASDIDIDDFLIGGQVATVGQFYDWAGAEPPDPGPGPQVRFARVTVGKLNVRTGPGTTFPVIGQVYLNAVPAVLDEAVREGEWWLKIGQNLWAAMFYRGRTYMIWVD